MMILIIIHRIKSQNSEGAIYSGILRKIVIELKRDGVTCVSSDLSSLGIMG